MKLVEVTVRTVELNTYRVEVEDDFDPDYYDSSGLEPEEWPLVNSDIKDWAITDVEEVSE